VRTVSPQPHSQSGSSGTRLGAAARAAAAPCSATRELWPSTKRLPGRQTGIPHPHAHGGRANGPVPRFMTRFEWPGRNRPAAVRGTPPQPHPQDRGCCASFTTSLPSDPTPGTRSGPRGALPCVLHPAGGAVRTPDAGHVPCLGPHAQARPPDDLVAIPMDRAQGLRPAGPRRVHGPRRPLASRRLANDERCLLDLPRQIFLTANHGDVFLYPFGTQRCIRDALVSVKRRRDGSPRGQLLHVYYAPMTGQMEHPFRLRPQSLEADGVDH
jgi:hypothetical protein